MWSMLKVYWVDHVRNEDPALRRELFKSVKNIISESASTKNKGKEEN